MYNNDIFDYCCDQKKGKIITSDCLDKSSGGELWPGSDCRDPCTFWQHAARVQVKFSINISSTQHHHRLQHYADDDSAQPADTKSIFLRRTAGGVHTAGRVVTAPTIMWEKIPLKKTRKISWKQTSSYVIIVKYFEIFDVQVGEGPGHAAGQVESGRPWLYNGFCHYTFDILTSHLFSSYDCNHCIGLTIAAFGDIALTITIFVVTIMFEV